MIQPIKLKNPFKHEIGEILYGNEFIHEDASMDYLEGKRSD